MRTDPLWEYGSFGCTGCHSRNLMNPQKAHELEGKRLAFAQGGNLGFRLVFITPPIHIIHHIRFSEAKWHPIKMPFKYSEAPLLIRNNGESDFPLLRQYVEQANCPSWESKFSCKFRARRKMLEPRIVEELLGEYERSVAEKKSSSFARTYIDALPYPPPLIDRNRKQTYMGLLES